MINRCIDCNKEITPVAKRCNSCLAKLKIRLGINGMKGKKHSEETKKNISKSEKGKIVSEITRIKQSNSRLEYIKKNPDKEKERAKKAGNTMKNRKQRPEVIERIRIKWQDKDYRNRRLKEMLKFRKPNKPERKIIDIIQNNNLPYLYVGDGKLIIEGFNPDFVHKNKKIIIEVFGDYWHNRKDWSLRDKRRIDIFNLYGYKTFIFWEHEIVERKGTKAKFSEEEIALKIKNLEFKGKRHNDFMKMLGRGSSL